MQLVVLEVKGLLLVLENVLSYQSKHYNFSKFFVLLEVPTLIFYEVL